MKTQSFKLNLFPLFLSLAFMAIFLSACGGSSSEGESPAQVCTPEITESKSCAITNGSGSQVRACAADGSKWGDYSSCAVTSCETGYHTEGSACVIVDAPTQVCTPNATESKTCNITNGSSSQNRACAADGSKWGDYSSCTVSDCDTGYHIDGNACVVDAAQPDNNLYVSNTGSNANDGSNNAPWKSINYAISQIAQLPNSSTPNSSKKVLIIKAGSYKELVTITGINNLTLKGETNTSGELLSIIDGINNIDPLTSGTFSSEETYRAGLLTAINTNNITIDSLKFINSKRHGIAVKGFVNTINILNNETRNTRGSGIFIMGSDGFTQYKMQSVNVKYNKVFDPQQGRWNGKNIYQEDITLYGGIDEFEISYNLVDSTTAYRANRNDGGPLGIDIKDGVKNGSIHHNTVQNIPSGGIYVDGSSPAGGVKNVKIYQNLVKNIANFGIQVSAEQGGKVENIEVFNNVVSKAETGLSCDNNQDPDSTNPQDVKYVEYHHNSVYNVVSGMWIDNTLCHVNSHDNVFSKTSSFDISFWGTTLDSIVKLDKNCFHQIGVANVQGSNAIITTISPFVDLTADNFHIKTTSSCTGKGLPNGINIGH